MDKGNVLLVVGSTYKQGTEREFEKWYSKHVWNVIEGGAKKATRYKLVNQTKGDNIQHLAIYEFENLQAAQNYDDTPTHSAAVDDIDKRDFTVTFRAHYECIGIYSPMNAPK